MNEQLILLSPWELLCFVLSRSATSSSIDQHTKSAFSSYSLNKNLRLDKARLVLVVITRMFRKCLLLSQYEAGSELAEMRLGTFFSVALEYTFQPECFDLNPTQELLLTMLS